jgi:glycosyltransferase involved in cell wall biosynthesis
MGEPLVSLCIPTHHGRAEQLAGLLASVEDQLSRDDAVEVCISDNASRDGTDRVVERCRTALGERLVYRRNPTDLGMSRNLLASVGLARGRFCWLLGSDDQLAPGALPEALSMLESDPDATGFGIGMLRVRGEHMADVAPQLPVEAVPPERRATVYRSPRAIVLGLGTLPTAMSANLFKRAEWQAVADAEVEEALGYPTFPQVYVLGRMAQRATRWVWNPRQLVLSRADTYYLREGVELGPDHTRHVIVLNRELDRLWRGLFGRRSDEYRHLMSCWCRRIADPTEIQSHKLARGRGLAADLRLLRGMSAHFWWIAEFRRRTLPLLLIPSRTMASAPSKPLPVESCRSHVEAEVPTRFVAGYQHLVRCRLTNRGPAAFPAAGRHPVRLASRWFEAKPDGDRICDGARTALFPALRPGRSRTVSLRVDAPPEPGEYQLRIGPVQERVRWFDDASPDNGCRIDVEVEPVPPAGNWSLEASAAR